MVDNSVPDINMSDIVKVLSTVIEPDEALNPIPVALIISGSELKKGLSAQKITKRVLAELPSIGACTGDLPDGSANVMDKVIELIVTKIIEALLTECVIEVGVPAGIPITGTCILGPVQGATSKNTKAKGIVR